MFIIVTNLVKQKCALFASLMLRGTMLSQMARTLDMRNTSDILKNHWHATQNKLVMRPRDVMCQLCISTDFPHYSYWQIRFKVGERYQTIAIGLCTPSFVDATRIEKEGASMHKQREEGRDKDWDTIKRETKWSVKSTWGITILYEEEHRKGRSQVMDKLLQTEKSRRQFLRGAIS